MRLIDADKLEPVLIRLKQQTTLLPIEDFIPMQIVTEDTPTVDAVEVTRCKDCKYNMYGNCYLLRWYVNETDFCAWGEKK